MLRDGFVLPAVAMTVCDNVLEAADCFSLNMAIRTLHDEASGV